MATEKKKGSFEGVILGMGNPLLDITAPVEMSYLEKYDLQLDSAILAEPSHMAIYKELSEMPEVKYVAGGATLNSIRVAGWMVSEGWGKVAYFGSIGEDDYGSKLEECASADGVFTSFHRSSKNPTGTCAALIHKAERSLVANLAAANDFSISHVEKEDNWKVVEKAQVMYCAGFFLTVCVDSLVKVRLCVIDCCILHILLLLHRHLTPTTSTNFNKLQQTQVAAHAAATNKVFCLNFSAPFIIDFFAEQLKRALPYADYIFANESEAAAYGKANGIGDEGKDIEAVALAVSSHPKENGSRGRVVVFTQGDKETIVAKNGVITKYAVTPLAKELLIDTNGAGDAFVGGFLAGLSKNLPIEKCVEAGHWASKFIIQKSGTELTDKCDFKF